MSSNKFILYGGPVESRFSEESESLGSVILRRLKDHGDKVLFINAVTGEKLTAKQVRQRSIRLAECLIYLGITANDVVGFCSENRVDYAVVMFATFIIGATLGPLNPTYTPDEIRHSLGLSKPSIIIASQTTSETVSKVVADYPFVRNVVVFEGKLHGPNFIDYQKLVNNNEIPSRGEIEPVYVSGSRTVIILYSSGTTGLPKGVQMTKTNVHFLLCLMHNLSGKMKEYVDEVRIVSALPWYHSFGLLTTVGLSLSGATILTMPKFNRISFLQAIQNYKGNVLLLSPPTMVFLGKSSDVDSYDISSIKYIICGAAPLRAETIEAVLKRVPDIQISQGYGLSETALAVLQSDPSVSTMGSVGPLRPGTWGKVVDVDTGKLLGPNQPGELCFKGDLVMPGYLNNVEANKSTIRDGWIHTGDIGYYTEKEEWYVVDRIKELIKFKGLPVPPAEIEAILLTHPDVVDSAVIGIPDESSGELPLGFVVKRPGKNPSEKEIIDFVAEKSSYAKRLHGGVRFIDEIPKNPTGKIMRRTLRDRMKNTKSKL